MSTRIGLPSIDVVFTQKAVTAVQRSERGVLAIVVEDSKAGVGVKKTILRRSTDLTKDMFDAANYNDLKRAFNVAVNKIYVFSATEVTDLAKVAKELDKVKYNYVCTNIKDQQDNLVQYVIDFNADSKGHKVVAVVANPTTADNKYVIKIKGTGGTDKYGETVTAESFGVRVASTLANLPMNRSLTYYVFDELADWDDSYISDGKELDYWIDEGWLTLVNDDEEVKCGRAVNSLRTFTSTDTEDMSYIIIVEAMNMILEDIYTTFKDYYVGKYKNSYDNQKLFLSSVNTYFRQLASEEILEPNYNNHCEIDVETQRNAWTAVGKEEAIDWDDATVKNMPFRTFVYVSGDVHIMNAIEDLKFTIAMA